MASHQILQSPQWVEFSHRVAIAGFWLAELNGLSEGIHRGTMCPVRGSEVSLLTTAPPVKFVFKWGTTLSCVPLIIRAWAPHCPKQGCLCARLSVCVCACICVCVCFTKNLFIYFSDPVLPELERKQLGIRLRLTWADQGPTVLFGVKEGHEEWQWEWVSLSILSG